MFRVEPAGAEEKMALKLAHFASLDVQYYFELIPVGVNKSATYVPAPGFTGKVAHSVYYKNAEEFKGKNVMTIGTGESAVDFVAGISEVIHSVTNWTCGPRLRFFTQRIIV